MIRGMRKYSGYNEDILRRIYLQLLPVTALNVLLPSLGTIINSFIVSSFLGADAMAALGIIAPLTSFFWVFVNIISDGASIFAGGCLGRGDADRVNGCLTSALTVLGVMGLVFGVVLGAFHGPIARLMGATDALADMSGSYAIGIAVSAVGMALSGPLASFLIFANQRNKTFVGVSIMVVLNLVCDVVFVKVFRLGLMGIGLASGVGYYGMAAYILPHFLKKSSAIHMDRKLIRWSDMPEMIRLGLPGASMSLCHFLRPIMYNKTLMRYVGVTAVSAFAAESSLASFFGSLSGGVGGLTLTVGSVIAGEKDSASLQSYARVVYKYGMIIEGTVCTVLFLFAKMIVGPFCGGSQEVLAMAVPSVRCFAVCQMFNLLAMITVRFYQSMNYGKLVTLLNVLDYLIFPVAWIWVLVPRLGADGAWYSFFLAEMTALTLIYVMLAVKLKKVRFTLGQWIQFGGSMDVAEADCLNATLYSMEEVIGISGYVQDFCAGHGVDKKTAMLSALAVEEMAGNIVQHGFSDGKKHAIDIRVLYTPENMVIRLRDDCRPFDPKERIGLIYPEDPVKNIGIRMIAGLCQDIRYQELFKMNVTTIVVAP